MRFFDAGHGYDELGASSDAVARVEPVLRAMHDKYFRVEAFGLEHIPERWAAILIANHSGTLPFDGAMIVTNVLFGRSRMVRPIADRFLPGLPFFGTWLARLGVVVGSRKNVDLLLERGEPILIFPEGTTGIGKPWSSRYLLQAWRVGHVELAIRHRVPVIPIAVIGAEEQMPQLGRIPLGGRGAPYIPITATPIPLPVKYQLHYGAPIDLESFDAHDAGAIKKGSELVRAELTALIQHGLLHRRGVFG